MDLLVPLYSRTVFPLVWGPTFSWMSFSKTLKKLGPEDHGTTLTTSITSSSTKPSQRSISKHKTNTNMLLAVRRDEHENNTTVPST